MVFAWRSLGLAALPGPVCFSSVRPNLNNIVTQDPTNAACSSNLLPETSFEDVPKTGGETAREVRTNLTRPEALLPF